MTRAIFLLFLSIIALLKAYAQRESLPKIKEPVFKKDTFNISREGAVGGGFFLNTDIINKTITKFHMNGGGVVVIPRGLWLSGPIVLKSNVNLHLKKGAILLFSKEKELYGLIKTSWEGVPQMRNQSPISACTATNIAITGDGIVDGNGDAWRMVKKDKLSENAWKKLLATGGMLDEEKKTWFPSQESLNGSRILNPGYLSADRDSSYFATIKDFLRPNLLLLTSCSNILLEGVTFQNSPAWCLHPLICENLVVRKISVKNPWYAQNGDGIDIESCKNVLIDEAVFDVGDDALCIKSGRDKEGRARGIPTQNVTIKNCIVYAAHGGFVIGSEMSGGVKNIYVSNCSFIGSDIGLRFKSTRGRGGVVENIFIKDIFMKDIAGEAILFDMYYMAKDPLPLAGEKRELPTVEFKPVDETTPVFKNFIISNIACSGASKAIFLRGLPEMHLRNIHLESMVFQSAQGIDIQEASDISFKNIKIFSDPAQPLLNIVNSDGLVFDKIGYEEKTPILLKIAGERSKNIQIKNTKNAQEPRRMIASGGAEIKNVTIIKQP